MSDVTEVPLAPEVFWGCVAALVLGLFSWALYKALPRSEAGTPPFEDVQSKLGLSSVPAGAFVIGALLWIGLLLILVAGLYAAIWDMLWQSKEFFEADDGDAQFRFLATRLAGTTAVLGVVVAFPVTLNRLKLTREQNETAREALFNQKITEAAADLHARRQVTLPETYGDEASLDGKARFNAWEDDVVRRNAAINRLSRLVNERPEKVVAEQIADILSLYVREVSTQLPALEAPETNGEDDLRHWALALPPARSDLETALLHLTRLSGKVALSAEAIQFDLKLCNLQRANLHGLDLRGATFGLAKLQGAQLYRANLQGVNLLGAELQAANLQQANLSGADLEMAELHGANLAGAKLQGSDLSKIAMSNKTVLYGSNFRGAAIAAVDETTIAQLEPFWQEIFADGSVRLQEGKGTRPEHWASEELTGSEFRTRWREWQRSIGQDPEKPE